MNMIDVLNQQALQVLEYARDLALPGTEPAFVDRDGRVLVPEPGSDAFVGSVRFELADGPAYLHFRMPIPPYKLRIWFGRPRCPVYLKATPHRVVGSASTADLFDTFRKGRGKT